MLRKFLRIGEKFLIYYKKIKSRDQLKEKNFTLRVELQQQQRTKPMDACIMKGVTWLPILPLIGAFWYFTHKKCNFHTWFEVKVGDEVRKPCELDES